jgi:hypothetical protein
MTVQLLHGHFNSKDAIDLLTRLVDVKIKFHEEKIHSTNIEEDIKMREHRIQKLQKALADSRQFIESQQGNISLQCDVALGG